MSPKIGKRVLKPGTSSVFVGCGSGGAPATWRLDVRDDGRGNKSLFSKRPRPCQQGWGRPKLFHYISAGGMRQLRRTSADDMAEDRRRSFIVFICLMFAVWLVFYFLPCV